MDFLLYNSFSICQFDIDLVYSFINQRCQWKYKPSYLLKNVEQIDFPYEVKGGEKPGMGVFFHPQINEDALIFTSNMPDGWASLLWGIAANQNVSYYTFKISNFPFMLEFSYFKNKNDFRIVRLMDDDGKLDFFQDGKPLFFEKKEIYNKRKKVDRLTFAILVDYANCLGIDISSHKLLFTKKPSLWLKESW